MKKTLGGDRLGSGQKSKIYGKEYNRSTHDLSTATTTPMTPGVLYPTLVLQALRGDKFTIKAHADVVTIPTEGPLFGSFKMQTDFFQCDYRLYQALLHNNPIALGLKVQQVMLPIHKMGAINQILPIQGKLNKSCLYSYLGVKGLGRLSQHTNAGISGLRKFNAIPMLAYYEIFKTYYANKQEENAYVIAPNENVVTLNFAEAYKIDATQATTSLDENEWNDIYPFTKLQIGYTLNENVPSLEQYYALKVGIKSIDGTYENVVTLKQLIDANPFILNKSGIEINYDSDNNYIEFDASRNIYGILKYNNHEIKYIYFPNTQNVNTNTNDPINLKEFPLSNIDTMRLNILSHHTLGVPFETDSQNLLPYSVNDFESSQYPLNGLVLKTYQSDIYNNWVNTEFIDGTNGIAAITAIQPELDGSIKIDEVILKERLYNLMNRIAVAGATYEDYLDVTYEETNHRAIEAPIYLGGMSSEIIFEQIVQTAPAEGQPLGTLAGRGRHVKRKGGSITVKIDQPSFIIAITSLTPRINYSQGNEFYMTDVKTIFDLHKPEMDGIGFQNLIGERLAWFDTSFNASTIVTDLITRSTVGKIPAWLEYMTNVNRTFGDFAEGDKSFMVLNRNYEYSEEDGIADVTTYIDPRKYNYAFAYKNLDAQNFWAQIYFDIKARRLMSAKIIPSI